MTNEKLQYVNPRELVAHANIRKSFDAAALAGLKASMEAVGLQQPIRAKIDNGRLVPVDGARRCMAAIELGWEKIAVLVDANPLNDGETIHRQLVANCQHEHLTVSELANALKQLMEKTGWSVTEVAKQLGMSVPTVTKSLAILTLPPAMLSQVDQGLIAASCAYELTKITDSTMQATLAEQVSTGKLTRDALIGAIKQRSVKAEPKPKSHALGRATVILDAQRSVTVSAPELNLESFIALLEELLSKARRERTRGVELSTFVKVLRDQSRVGIAKQE
jgi:ParB family transcriptional regulator, chromosome partitioning protein